MRKLLLDSCAPLWLASGNDRLSQKALDAIDNAAIVYVSAITAWEISLNAERGQLILPQPADEWFIEVLDQHNLILAPLDLNVLLNANKLPWHHKDPADRMIIATAIKENATLVTGDGKISQYDVKTLC